ncbi:site-specific DNA-methyltransferase [Ornithinimicrobium sp. Y1847]|uniref:site-specific DNA-methyltransferase n=1 Tax=Ornithinimicrobium sp. Y1847 TaxID=3405419 RepID=UPI003B6809AB
MASPDHPVTGDLGRVGSAYRRVNVPVSRPPTAKEPDTVTAGPRLELTWPGKDKFLLTPKDDQGKPVWVERSHPAASEVRLTEFTGSHGDVGMGDPYADNLLFTGDSLDVLRVLAEVPEFRREYLGKVRLAYWDPPFNTGQAFDHYDDWLEHSTWLSFMRERLLVARELLTDDGSIWIHVDDAEAHRVRLLLDEVFGASNFVASVVWKRRNDPRNTAQYISMDHDTILVYARDLRSCRFNQLPRTERMDAAYTNPDDDHRGPWRRSDTAARNYYSKGLYAVTTPSGRVIDGPPSGSYWRVSQEELERLDADGRIYWGKDGSSRPYVKRFLTEVAGGRVPSSVWHPEEVGFVRNGKEEVRALIGDVFATPKPERLLERVITIGSDPGDVVLDCFAGSGTTAAVAHKMGRRWVTVELNPDTADEYAQMRLQKVVDGTDRGGITDTAGWTGGGGFRTVTIGPSMYEVSPVGVMLADWATNGKFARAVAGQLGFDWQEDAAPFCGVRGRMRLAVLDGTVGVEEARHVVAGLADQERVTIVAKAVLPGVEELVRDLSKGSRVRKAPRDLLEVGAARARRRMEGAGT